MKPRVLLVFVSLALSQSVFGHEVPVHVKITEAAVNGSTGWVQYLNDNNTPINQYFLEPMGTYGVITGGTASGEMQFGSAREDDQGLDAGGFRSINHFYDPIHKIGLSGSGGLPSIQWASWSNQVNSTFYLGGMNVYTWQNARIYQSNSIASPGVGGRSIQEGLMFRSIGQVMHLLEDTSQPQHARNEQHLDKYPITGLDTRWKSKFETWGKNHITSINFSPQSFDWVGAGFTCLSNFWDSARYDGTSDVPLTAGESAYNAGSGPLLGLAEWCNGNFLTVRGTYADLPGLNPAPQKGVYPFPYPTSKSTDLMGFLFNPIHFAKMQPSGKYRFNLTKLSQGVVMSNHCSVDILGVYYPSPNVVYSGSVQYIHPDDSDIIQAYHNVVIPRAIAYSTGLLNYYFRGRLQLTNFVYANSTQVQFTAKNISQQNFSGGGFQVFTDDSSGNRTPVSGLTTSYDPTSGLTPGASITGTFNRPTGWISNVTVAYFGTIGYANGKALDPVDAGLGVASAYTNIAPGITFDVSWGNTSCEVDLYLVDPGGVVVYEADLAPANGNTNSAYCISVGGDFPDSWPMTGATNHMVVSNMKDGTYQLWVNYEGTDLGSAPSLSTTLVTSITGGPVLTTENFTLATPGSGQYGHHGWPLGIQGPETLPSWYVRKNIVIKGGAIVSY